ncbi:MAG: carbohydrate binding family 9 domain-containing protein [Gemmatimonadaceae bacterium]|nr:carbohydrate binding family 9 domain-containing protein [Gemmatimonadota bacterium]MBK9977231.1 carbohydrate binding family 9 domain-containing protein [Gemmatimonadota bacterium]MCC7323633.1 carbohydrate binding family 9 domain-containing protein [Gemmatimonadaceae bacterium]
MLSISFAALSLLLPTDPPAGGVFNGRAGQVDVAPPRLEQSITIDGLLTEPAWREAALLTGFSQFQPTDRRAATDSTDVLVWYSPTAIHFGIRAYAPPGATNARLSDRDKISADDYVEIILSTFNDGRQAFVFGVNALGVQADGTLNELQSVTSSGSSATAARATADLSANFVYESKGRVTDFGYEVEVRIPFKSLRYQPRDVQDWGLQLVRKVQHLGHEDTWTPARRDAASFLQQSGRLIGLRDLRRGLVVDLNPSVVAFQTGQRKGEVGWGYVPQGPEYGGTVRWGVTNNLTLNGTVNPDFSQVESDVVAFQYDPRQALFYPERRPFFLEGIENFAVGNNLIYTRRIVQPDVAVKLTGKALGTNLALLSAYDDRSTSITGNGHPMFNILRGTRDLGKQSRIGVTYTDRVDGDDYNRLLGFDGRFIARKIWSLAWQGAVSRTRTNDSTGALAPLWGATLARQGRRYSFSARINAIDEDFDAQAGFLSRGDVVDYIVANTWTFFRPTGSLVETWGFTVRGQGTSHYDAFVNGRASQDRKLHFTSNAAVRGGWRVSGALFFENFGFDKDLYAGYHVERNLGTRKDTVVFTAAGDPRLHNIDLMVTIATPEFSKFSGDFQYIGGKDENFEEWQSGLIHFVTANLRYRPTDQLRIEGQYQHQEFNRWTDGTTVSIRKVPRLKVEYQASRYIFFRMIGQYDTQEKLDRRDDGRTNDPLLFKNADGSFTRLAGFKRNRVRADWLFSYQPTPGTVFFLGYGSSMDEREPLKFRDLRRTADGFFVKWSYLYRL